MMEVKKSSLLPQNPKLAEDKAIFSRANRVVGSRDKDKAPKCYPQYVAVPGIYGRPLLKHKSSGNNQKPFTPTASAGADELVKHMSNVPGYLQRMEKSDNLQEKALNFGVLDWKRLEKWTSNHTHVVENTSGSSTHNSASSSFSMFAPSSRSCVSNSNSYEACRTKIPSSHGHSSILNHEHISQEKAFSNSMRSDNPDVARRRCPIRHRVSIRTEQCLFSNSTAAKPEITKQTFPKLDDLSDGVSLSSEINHLPTTSSHCLASKSANKQMKSPGDVSKHQYKRFKEVRHEYTTSVCENDDCSEDELSYTDESIFGSLRKSANDSQRFSFESTESGHVVVQTEPDHQFSLEAFNCRGFQSVTTSANSSVAHSCTFPYDIQGELSYLDGCRQSEVPCYSAKASPHLAEVATATPDGCQGKHDKFVNVACSNSAAKMCEKGEMKPGNPTGRELLPINHFGVGSSGMIRSTSLKDSSVPIIPKYMTSERDSGGKVVNNERGRRSPLRRLLDPFLKPKAPCQARPARVQPCERRLPLQEGLASIYRPRSSNNTGVISSTDSTCYKKSNPPSWMPLENHCSINDGKHETSTKQALLRLSWKNGLPLLTFSMNESDILAVTRKKGTCIKQASEYIYTFHYVHETKKKIGSWISQGNKARRKELTSRVVGQMNVSCLRCVRQDVGVREFALFGPEMRPTSGEPPEHVPPSELAAIVVRISQDNLERSLSALPREDGFVCQQLKRLENEGLRNNDPTIAVILPSDVHGLSGEGKPSPLVDRWKSGGLCDCGGWDIGCSLSILTSKLKHDGAQSCDTTDGSKRVELFSQGGEQGSGSIFNLVAFKKELYTAHFHASIAPLQAFSICVALLHSEKHTGLDDSQVHQQGTSAEASPVKDPATKQVGPSSMSIPYHPPLSPVGRA